MRYKYDGQMSNGQCRPDEDDSSYWVTEPDHEYDWEEASVCASIFISLCDLCYLLLPDAPLTLLV